MDKETIKRLAKECGAELLHPEDDLYLIDDPELVTFATAIIAEFVSKQVPVAYRFNGNYCIKENSLHFNKPQNKLHLYTKLYTLDEETK